MTCNESEIQRDIRGHLRFYLWGHLKDLGELDTLRILIYAHTTEAACKLAVAGEMAIPYIYTSSNCQHHYIAYAFLRISTVSTLIKEQWLALAGVVARPLHD